MQSRSSSRRMVMVPISSKIIVFGKFFLLLIAGTFTFLALIGFGTWLQAKFLPSSSGLNGIAGGVPDALFIEMLNMEMTNAPSTDQTQQDELHAGDLSRFVFELLTGINPHDPRSVLAGEISGLQAERTVLFRRGVATDTSVYPIDHTPPQDLLLPVPGKEENEPPAGDVGVDPSTDPEQTDESDMTVQNPGVTDQPVDRRHAVRAFIYHSHNRESWVPELEGVTEPKDAYDSDINITLLGKRLAELLEEEGVGAVVSDKDYPTAVKQFNYNLSYSYSLKTVQEASATYPELQYYFDIHRDSQGRKLTTATIDGLDYAQVYFVIGQKNPDWKKNEQFAQQVHDKLEEKYPGLSRGIYGKTANTGNGEYNQHISPNAILVEVGGPENTLEESYRTIEILAEIISELIWDAEKVDAPVPSGEVVRASTNPEERGEPS